MKKTIKIDKYEEYCKSLHSGFTEDKFVEFLKEGLIKTYPIKFAVRYLNKFISSMGITHFLVDFENESIFIKLTKSKIDSDKIISIINVLNTSGYFPSIFRLYDINDNQIDYIKYVKSENDDNVSDVFNKNFHMIQIESEAKYNLELKVPNKLYHLTNIKNKDKILSIGLSPKSKSRRAHHPDRIYLGFSEIGCENLARQFNKDKTEKDIFSLFEIDTSVLKLKVYADPDYIDGCWTSDNIPKSNIKLIKDGIQ